MITRTFRRRAVSVLPVALLLTAARCVEDAPIACARAPMQTLLFVDQSASSVVDAATRKMYDDTVAAVLGTSLGCKGDAVHGFLVHANTRGKVGRQDVVNVLSPPDVDGKPKLARLKAENQFEARSAAFMKTAQSRVPSIFDTPIEPALRRHTDMLGTLEVISDELADAENSSTVRIYFLGDMHESMPGNRRNFDARRPATVQEAEQWADEDMAILSQMKINRDRFKNAQIRVLLGNLADKPGMPEVRRYWEKLFENAGFDPNRIRF